MKVIVSAAGTGGHIYPALAVCDKIKEKSLLNDVLFIGTHNRMEKEIVPKLGYKYEELKIYGFSKNLISDLKNVKNLYRAYKKSIKIIKKFKPDIIIGFGGYVTLPVLLAGKKLGIKCVIHEQNYIPGKSNKYASRYCDIVYTSFLNSGKYFKNKNILYTGNPCSEKSIATPFYNKTKLGFHKEKKLILIVMGSMGSSAINIKLKKFLENFSSETDEILYITGKNNYKKFIENYKENVLVKVLPYFENLPGLIKDSDLIISRAGATTISEILALKKLSIIIPSPNVANNHQYYNALDLEKRKLTKMIEEKDLTEKILMDNINELLNNNKIYNTFLNNLKNIIVDNSATLIYDNMKKLVK